MKSLVNLHIAMLAQIGELCSVNTAKDLETLRSRWNREGDGFLTITLPTFGKALERALADGGWSPSLVSSFRHRTGLPVFLRGFLEIIFDSSATLRDDMNPDLIEAVRCLRQFCYLTQKIKRPCTPYRERKALASYVATDESLIGLPLRIPPEDLNLFRSAAQRLFGDMFQHCDNTVANWNLFPKHGPGAVAESISQKEKWNFPYWTQRLEDVFPSWRYCPVPVEPVSLGAEIPVRVITVPKTQKTPRIIAIEPSAMQYAQQALWSEIDAFVSKSNLRHEIGFRDQSRNRRMALRASRDGSLATLDLSEASDRVHWWLVQQLLLPYPHLLAYVSACRSYKACVPGHGEIFLTKFASMGSALTFPIETVIFRIIVEVAAVKSKARRSLKHNVSCYGDDIIVPVELAGTVTSHLELFGFKVNTQKSFASGYFRESCGGDYFAGEDVGVVKLRSELPRSRADAAEIASLAEFRNLLYSAGYWTMVKYVDGLVDPFRTPVAVNSVEGTLGRLTYCRIPTEGRYNDALCRYELKVPVLKPHRREYRVDGVQGLFKWFLEARLRDPELPLTAYDGQERPVAFSIINRWKSAQEVLLV